MPPSSPITIDVPSALDPDSLAFRSMVGVDSLGRCFEYEIEVTSAQLDVASADVLGKSATVHLDTTDGGTRHFNGVITAFDYVGPHGDISKYRFVVRPWLWLLTQSAGCRIFQNKNVIDIITAVFQNLEFSDFDVSYLASGDYPVREYVVQYRETDFNFVTRLMERDGIYYFFQHDTGKHTLVLVDANTVHDYPPSGGDDSASSGYQVPFRPPDAHRAALTESVEDWRLGASVAPGIYSHADFDFTKSRSKLFSTRKNARGFVHDDLEVYDYPGGFEINAVGDTHALVRLQEQQMPLDEATGWSNARKLTVGNLFGLTEHPRDDQNQDYLVTSATYRLIGEGVETGGVAGAPVYDCRFNAIEASAQFRSRASARKPLVNGPQTATVVGPSDREIWTDQYGRVKLQFRWDREGAFDEDSSCWVRVAQLWAGTNWGAMFIPRIGQEVIVDFLEGDPDRPIVTGRVYNDANMPPYDLPAHQTQSGIKSRSTKGGNQTNANEIRFEDLKGSEEFFVQAEKDLNAVVKNNEMASVGVNRTVTVGTNDSLSVGSNRSAKIGANDSIQVGGDRSLTVQGNESTSVGGNRSVSTAGNETTAVGGNQSLTVGGSQTETVTGTQTTTVIGARTHTVAASETIVVAASQTITTAAQTVTVAVRQTTVAGGDSLSVGADLSTTIGGGRTTSVAGDDSLSAAGAGAISFGKDGSISVGKQLTVEATDGITLKAGSATITLAKNGDITIKGANITVNGSGNVVIKGSKIAQN
jgi:type VI secretion system secreted protein VgrG